jgi:hypothetical protein
MDDLPNWSNRLQNLYVCVRMSKNNKTLLRSYYRKVEVEKLKLAEKGINQEKIRQVCRYLSQENCVRCKQSKNCQNIIKFLNSSDFQTIINFT